MSKRSSIRARMMFVSLAAALGGGAAGCYYASDAGSSGDTPPADSDQFPCEAAKLLSTCWACHGTPPRGGAEISLDKLTDLTAASMAAPGQSVAQRALARLRDTNDPMPPVGYPRPSDADITAFEGWVDGGMPGGTCSSTSNPGDPAPTVCTSGSKWTGGNRESSDMNPGLPCRECHLRDEPRKAYFFMGTVYPTLHEQDLCYSRVPTGTRVEILDASGAVRATMQVRAEGNFYSNSTSISFNLPYTARVVSPSGSTIAMTTPQTDGDCNGCHTEQGASDAIGRILLPTP
ncbi:MAG TPA: hypothetical protein VHE35_17920 [Kofleriaceae bacterium]|nr:hypothetical protein [Kofleriaceae bacterium]